MRRNYKFHGRHVIYLQKDAKLYCDTTNLACVIAWIVKQYNEFSQLFTVTTMFVVFLETILTP